MIRPCSYTYEEFPVSDETAEGMRSVPTTREDYFVTYHENVPYIKRNGQNLRLQILKPEYIERGVGRFPCIVYIKGSGWRRQELYRSLPSLSLFASRGYVIALVEYRHSGLAPFPAQVIDAKTAVRFMRKNAELYGIDSENIFVWGDSSGGHTALFVGLTQDTGELETVDFEGFSSKVNAVVDFFGPADITSMGDYPSCSDMGPGSPAGMLLGRISIPENPDKAKSASPINYIRGDVPPVLILHGDRDRKVPFNQSVSMYKALIEKGCDCEFIKLKDADHGGPQFWTENILDMVEKFIKRCAKSKL